MPEKKPESVATLYVVFHGLIPLVKFRTHYRAVLLEMSDHRVAVGHWLTERSLPKGVSLTLTGVKSGFGTLEESKNIIVETDGLDPGMLSEYRYADIFLPIPLKAHSFYTADAKEVLGGTTKPSSTNYSHTQVFEYELSKSVRDVSLSSLGFTFQCEENVTLPCSDRSVSVIHVTNDPELEVSDEHSIEEFNLGCRLFQVDLRATKAIDLNVNEPTPPPGILVEELVPGPLRQAKVLSLVDVFRVVRDGGEFSDVAGSTIGASKFCGAPSAVVVGG